MRLDQQAPQQSSLEEILDRYVRVFEEKLIIDVAAETYAGFAHRGGIQLQDLDGLLSAPPETVELLFRQYDADCSGTIDPKELLAIVRHLNFSRGYCDACFAPVGGADRAFVCVPCESFMLCKGCYPNRASIHPEHSEYQTAASVELKNEATTGLPRNIGAFLRQRVQNLFEEIDDNGDGELSVEEFQRHCLVNGMSPACLDFVIGFDLDGDGRISPREALYMLTGLEMMRACNECDELSFVSDESMLTCVECAADYDVCANCWNAGRCSHPHDRFEVTKPFQLSSVGLYYDRAYNGEWHLAVGNHELWHKYEPFVGDKLNAELVTPPAIPPRHQDYSHHQFQFQRNENEPSDQAGSGWATVAKAVVRELSETDEWEDAQDSVLDGAMSVAGEVFSWFM